MTKADRTRHEPDDLLNTTPVQDLAIEVLVGGGTTLSAAEEAGVARQTVSLWRNHHPGFKAALNSRRRELLTERADRIRDLDAQALAVMAEAIDDGDRSIALAWIKTRRLDNVDVADIGQTRAEAIIDVEASRLRERPEHVGSLMSLLDDTGDKYAITRNESRELAEAELTMVFEDVPHDAG